MKSSQPSDYAEQILQTLLEATRDSVIVVTVDMRVSLINAAGAHLFGRQTDEIVGQSLSELLPDQTSCHLREAAEKVFATGQPARLEQCYPLPNGDHCLDSRLSPLGSSRESPSAVLCVSRDVTEKKQIELILQKSHAGLLKSEGYHLTTIVNDLCVREERYRLLAENMRDALVIQDPELNIVYASPSVELLFGYTPEETLELKMHDIVTAESLAKVQSSYGAIMEEAQGGGEPQIPLLEFEYIRKDGNRFWGEFHPSLIRDSEGTIVGSQGILRDITERRQAEERLSQSESFLNNIFASIQDGISILDTDYNIIRTNVTMEKWYAHAMPLVGKKCHVAYHGKNNGCDICPTRKTLETGEPAVDVVPITGPGGAVQGWVDLFSFPLRDVNSGRMIGVIEYVRDITERKKAEQERLHLEKKIQHRQKLESLGVLAGGIAHDFNNLLVGVLGNAEMALLDLDTDSPTKSHIQDIQKASERLMELSNQMLAYSGKGKFVVQTLDLSALVAEIVELLKVSVSKKLELRLRLPDRLPPIKGDRSQIHQIIMNLITNAAEAYDEGYGVISVRTELLSATRQILEDYTMADEFPEADYVMLTVSDNGCGMDKETKHRIFDPFFTTKFTGRGLGLAAVLGIVRGHGGAIKVQSEVKKGTTVNVLFPCETREVPTAPDDCLDESRSFQGQGLVLLVDDEEAVRDTGTKLLNHMGYDVLTAVNGIAAVQRVQEHAGQLDCVMLDLTMPKKDGLGTFHEIRRICPQLPIILCSGYHLEGIKSQLGAKSLTHFLQKPYRYQALVQIMKDVLQKN